MEPPRKAVRSECQFKCMQVCTLYSLSMSTCWWKPHKALRDGIVCLTCDISTHRLSAAIMPAWPRAHMLSSWSTAGDLGIACRMSRHTLQARSSSAPGCMTSRVYFGDWDILPAMPIGGGGRAYSRWRGPDILLSFFFPKQIANSHDWEMWLSWVRKCGQCTHNKGVVVILTQCLVAYCHVQSEPPGEDVTGAVGAIRLQLIGSPIRPCKQRKHEFIWSPETPGISS